MQLAFSWTDQLATSVLLVVMLLLALGLWVLGLQVLVTVGLLWVFRWVRRMGAGGCLLHNFLSVASVGEAFSPRCAYALSLNGRCMLCGFRQDALLL